MSGGAGYFVLYSDSDAFSAFLTKQNSAAKKVVIFSLFPYEGLNDESVTVLAPVNHRSCEIFFANWRIGNGETL